MRNFATIILSGLFGLLTITASANGIGIIDGSEGVYFTLLESGVRVEVNNQIAQITATQVFRNDTGSPTSIKYAFPLNENANPIALRWQVGGVWREASVSANEQNTDIPGTGGDNGAIDPHLARYLGSSPLFFTPNDSIPADSLIVFELTYVELLPYFLGKVSFYFKNDLRSIQHEPLQRQSFDFLLYSERAILAVELLGLPSVDENSGTTATVSYEAEGIAADFDYLLEYELSSDGLGVFPLSTYIADSIFNCDDFGDGFVTFIIEPESNVNTEVIEKNFTLVIDRSGSMSGNKMVQARDAASFIVNNLNAGDNFNIISFSSSIQSLFQGQVPFTLANMNTALSFIDGLQASGGTNIAGALTTAIGEFQVLDPNKANIILFFTDGQATVGITHTAGILDAVRNAVNAAETSIFLFSFGIGEDVNKGLLTALSRQNNGLVKFVKDDDLEAEITSFFLSINNPVLINTAITFEPDIIHQAHPYPYPNLYKGQQLILSGRYQSAQPVNMRIEGQAFNVPVSYDFSFDLADTSAASLSVLPKIWAKQKMDVLTLDFYLAESEDEQERLQAEIDSISTCYGVVSVDFSSFEDDPISTEYEEVLPTDYPYKITAYPMPFRSALTIEVWAQAPTEARGTLELYEASGRLLSRSEGAFSGHLLRFDLQMLDQLPAGIYYCKLLIGSEVAFFKVVKS